jgi:hypothetical protein
MKGTKTALALLCFGLAALPALAQVARVREAALARVPLARSVAADPQLLGALQSKNASRESPDEIRRKDAEWTANAQLPLRKELASSPCAQRLRDLTKSDPLIVEAILMDANGANVCISRETSDYWQGDEAKFQKTFGADKEVFLDEPAFDSSSGTYAIQLSVLVKDGETKAGALTLTLRVRKDHVTSGGGA